MRTIDYLKALPITMLVLYLLTAFVYYDWLWLPNLDYTDITIRANLTTGVFLTFIANYTLGLYFYNRWRAK